MEMSKGERKLFEKVFEIERESPLYCALLGKKTKCRIKNGKQRQV